MLSIALFTWISAFDHMDPLIWIFSACCPYGFSWKSVAIIALDRALIVTKGQIHKNYITMKILYRIITLHLLLSLVVAILFRLRSALFEGYSQVFVFVFRFLELSFVFITSEAPLCSIKVKDDSKKKDMVEMTRIKN